MSKLHASFGLSTLLVLSTIAGCAHTGAGDPGKPDAAEVAASGAEHFELDHFRWRGDITGSESIVAVNEWGDLRVRTTHRGELAVSAVIQKIGTTEDEFEVRVDRNTDSLNINVATLTATPGGRVDLTLLIPPGLDLEARTLDGLAEIKYSGDIEVQTRGGQILITSSQIATASSISGDIVVRLDGNEWPAPLAFESASGDITLSLPEDANVELHVRTPGAINPGLPAESRVTRHEAGFDATLGGGGPELTIRSDSGDVRIVARPL